MLGARARCAMHGGAAARARTLERAHTRVFCMRLDLWSLCGKCVRARVRVRVPVRVHVCERVYNGGRRAERCRAAGPDYRWCLALRMKAAAAAAVRDHVSIDVRTSGNGSKTCADSDMNLAMHATVAAVAAAAARRLPCDSFRAVRTAERPDANAHFCGGGLRSVM